MQSKHPSSRRRFLQGMSLATFSTALGMPIPFGRNLAPGLFPVALGAEATSGAIPGKPGLRVLSDRPINAETPVALLDDEFTSNALHFVRNNGNLPTRPVSGPLTDWSLTIDGEVETELKLSMNEVQNSFRIVERALVIECGGNGRAGFNPPASGNQWTLGAVGCAKYRGVRLRDVLKKAGVKSSAVYIGYYGEDRHLSGDLTKETISRGFPIAKALDEHTILSWEMNGEPLPRLHGYPLRLICPGWPGSTSGKWLKRIVVRNQVHDGEKMTGTSYRLPRYPVAPGAKVPEEDMAIIEEMPVKSIITRPSTGIETAQSRPLELRGHAWSGFGDVRAMDVSVDFGATWQRTKLKRPANKYAWQQWTTEVTFPTVGYYEIWARATDEKGNMQPMVVPGWNPKGYCNNAMQRIAVKVV